MRPRSGLALKHGITCLNTPGTIDSDYRGEVKVILANLGAEPFEIVRGERIAQLVPAPVLRARFARSRTNWTRPRAAPAASARPGGDASATPSSTATPATSSSRRSAARASASCSTPTVAVVGAGGIGSPAHPVSRRRGRRRADG